MHLCRVFATSAAMYSAVLAVMVAPSSAARALAMMPSNAGVPALVGTLVDVSAAWLAVKCCAAVVLAYWAR